MSPGRISRSPMASNGAQDDGRSGRRARSSDRRNHGLVIGKPVHGGVLPKVSLPSLREALPDEVPPLPRGFRQVPLGRPQLYLDVNLPVLVREPGVVAFEKSICDRLGRGRGLAEDGDGPADKGQGR